MEKLSIPFDMHYENGVEIDFDNEGIGIIPSLKMHEIPHFIEKVLEETGFHQEYSGFSFGPVIDEGRTIVESGYVKLYILNTDTILTEREFFEVTLQLANKALEAVDQFQLKEKKIIDNNWIEKVKLFIPALQTKIKNSL
jgi:hypothetical protein